MRGDYLVLDTKMIESHDVLGSAALESVEVLDCEMIVFVPSKFKARAIICYPFYGGFIEQVIDLLFVDLEIRAVDGKFLLLQI